jgi:hypothetical protein
MAITYGPCGSYKLKCCGFLSQYDVKRDMGMDIKINYGLWMGAD